MHEADEYNCPRTMAQCVRDLAQPGRAVRFSSSRPEPDLSGVIRVEETVTLLLMQAN